MIYFLNISQILKKNIVILKIFIYIKFKIRIIRIQLNYENYRSYIEEVVIIYFPYITQWIKINLKIKIIRIQLNYENYWSYIREKIYLIIKIINSIGRVLRLQRKG